MEQDNVNVGEALVEKILEDANAKAHSIVDDAENYCESALTKAKSTAEENAAEDIARANAVAESIIENKRTLTKIEVKKDALTCRREIVESVYAVTLEKLLKMKKTEYIGLIDALIGKYAQKGDVVILSENAPATAKEVASAKNAAKLGLSVEKTGNFSGGIILSGEKFDKDLTFTALVDSIKESTETEIAEKLFGNS